MKERKVVEPVGEQLLRFRRAWSGLERHLVDVLGTVGGPEAKGYLERYAADPRAKHAESARRHLGR